MPGKKPWKNMKTLLRKVFLKNVKYEDGGPGIYLFIFVLMAAITGLSM